MMKIYESSNQSVEDLGMIYSFSTKVNVNFYTNVNRLCTTLIMLMVARITEKRIKETRVQIQIMKIM